MAPFSLLHGQNVAPGVHFGLWRGATQAVGQGRPFWAGGGHAGQRGYWKDETETGASVRETLRECFSGNALGLRLSGDQARLLNPGLRDSPENSFAFHQNSLGCRGAAGSAATAL